MAFLCPVRIRSRSKKKKAGGPSQDVTSSLSEEISIGRITGSSSIETLVRVGLEKEAGLSPGSRMVVLHDFTPCVDDELEVKRGAIVNLLYSEAEWDYVIHENREGFIPHSFCVPYGSPLGDLAINKKKPRSSTTTEINEASPFYKDPSGRFIVLYKFVARDENDVNVERGELITVLNKDDPDWFWVLRSDGNEGFVPSAFVFPLNPDPASSDEKVNEKAEESTEAHGTELVMLYDYKAQAPDDISVRRGDWVYADLNHQNVEGWLWAYAPNAKNRKYGFIPKAYARPPAMTSL